MLIETYIYSKPLVSELVRTRKTKTKWEKNKSKTYYILCVNIISKQIVLCLSLYFSDKLC